MEESIKDGSTLTARRDDRTSTRAALAIAIIAALVLPVVAVRAPRASAAPPSVAGLSVFVGYAENKEVTTPDPANFPAPWAGAPNTTFLGGPVPGQAACGALPACYDAGAIRLDNPGSKAVTVDRVSVDDHSSLPGGQVFDNLWGSFTVGAGKSVILTENPPNDNPGFDNFDTSSFPDSNCKPLTVAPTVTITVKGVATTLADSGQVLYAGGTDAGSCSPNHNESIQWQPIGAPLAPSASLSLSPASSRAFSGSSTTATAALLDGAGDGLPNVSVKFVVTSGPNAGLTGSAVSNAAGHASFTYQGTAQGEDTIVASVTTVGSFRSNVARVMWTNDATTGWSSTDIGNPTPAGQDSLDTSSGTWTVQGGGGGIGGSLDHFHFVAKTLSGNGGIGARVVGQTSNATNAQAGVMLRNGTSASAPFYAALVSPGGGVAIERRASSGANAVTSVHATGTTPAFLWVAANSGTVQAYGSSDGYAWAPIRGSAVALNLGSNPLAGLAVSSNDSAQLDAATIDSVAVSTKPPAPAPTLSCPAPFLCADIGNPAPGGGQSFDAIAGAWTVAGGGSDIFGTADQFHFTWTTLQGDGSVTARVVTQSDTDDNAKAGVMFRASTDPGAPHYAALVSPAAGIKVQERSTLGGSTSTLANPSGTTPVYLRVTRAGNTFSAYTSANGTTWNLIAGSTFAMTLGPKLLEGLAVTSHRNGVLGTATFDNVSPAPDLSMTLGAATAPTNVTASAVTGGAKVSWTAPASDNGSPITGYVITIFMNGIAEPPDTFGSTATTQTVSGLQKGQHYAFEVAAVNGNGTGAASAASNTVSPK